MPDRLLRDEIWESDRFLDLPTDIARIAFIRFLSLADDFGNFEGGIRRIHRCLHSCTQVKTEDATLQAIEAMMNADLIRRYTVDKRELFHIPRLRPHRQYLVRKMPASPWDDDAELGKRIRMITKRGLAKEEENQQLRSKNSSDIATTSQARCNDVAEGVGVGVGVGEKIYTRSASGSRTKTLGISDLTELGVDRQTAEDWLVIREKKRSPLTKTALKAIQTQATEAGLTLAQAIQASAERGWVGFRADWWRNDGGVVETDWHETRGGVERRAEAMGLGKWDEAKERWAAYRARVIKAAKEKA